MKQVNLYYDGNPKHAAVGDWLRPRYQKSLGISIGERLPDALLCIEDTSTGEFHGAMGLNFEVRFDLFRNDQRCQQATRGLNVCEQSILQIDRSCPRALMLLIAGGGFLALQRGFDAVIFAGICPSLKALMAMGMEIEEIGAVDLTVLSAQAQRNYGQWHKEHEPRHYLFHTAGAAVTMVQAVDRYAFSRQGTELITISGSLDPRLPYIGHARGMVAIAAE